MRRTISSIAVAALTMTLGLAVGCGEDPPNDDWDVGADAGEDTDTADPDPDATDTGEDDTWMPQDTAMDSGRDTDDEDTAGDTDTGVADATDTRDPAPDADVGDVPDIADTTDTGGELNRDALPMTFGAGSFISEFYVDADSQTRDDRSSGDPRCCFDVQIDGTDQNYDSEQDNALADFLDNIGALAGFGIGDVNQNINDGIERGDFVYLFEYKDWDSGNWQDDGSITMYAHPGEDANPPWDWNQVQMGNGTFDIQPKSYDANGNPISEFQSVSTTADGSQADLSAGDGLLRLVLDFGSGLSTTFNIHRAQLTADVPSNANVNSGGEVVLQNGKLGGAIPKGDMFTGINRAASSCMCYDLNNNKMITQQSAESYQCDTDPSCSCSGTVGQLEQFCSSLRSSIASATDVNLNSAEPDNDALSFGASFSAVEANINGVAP